MTSIASDFSIFTMAPAASCAADPARTKTSKDVIRNLRIISICSHHLMIDKHTQSRCEQVVRGAKAVQGRAREFAREFEPELDAVCHEEEAQTVDDFIIPLRARLGQGPRMFLSVFHFAHQFLESLR